MAFQLLLILSAIVGFSAARQLTPDQFKVCSDSGATIENIDVTPCESIPCLFPRNSTATIQLTFTPKAAFDTFDVQVFGVISKAEIPFQGISRKGCDTLTDPKGNPACPVSNLQQQYIYKAEVQVKPSYPPLDVDIKFKLGSGAICFSFPVKIVKSSA
ncbi:hypothetical protein CHUAL_013776 [Chamberlinius hualienensis]